MELQQIPKPEKPIQRQHHVRAVGPWQVFSIVGRVDSFNFQAVKAALEATATQHPQRLVVDLAATDFLSIPFIKLLAQIGANLRKNGSKLTIVAPSEKLKRQIDIFASLDEMHVYRSIDQLSR